MAGGSSWRGKRGASSGGGAKQRRGRYKLSIRNADRMRFNVQESGINMFHQGNTRGWTTLADAMDKARAIRRR